MPPGTPFHGFIHPFPIRVDEFDSPPTLQAVPALHLLSHTHTDHLVGLSAKSFSSLILCSQDAKEMLLKHEVYKERALAEMDLRSEAKLARTFGHLKVSPVVIEGKTYYDGSRDLLRVLPLNTPTRVELSDDKKVTITLIDANHCPGSVMFLVEDDKASVLHTGDLRAEPWFLENLARNPFLQPYIAVCGSGANDHTEDAITYTPPLRTLDAIYLDTACLFSPSQVPSKAEAVDGLIKLMKLLPSSSSFFVNAWTWGYEEVLKGLARAFQCKIHVDRYKHNIYNRLSDPCMRMILTEDPNATRIHACERFDRCTQVHPFAADDPQRHIVYINPVTMSTEKWTTYFEETFRQLRTGSLVDCLLVPLSRHSPLPELRAFVSMFRPKRLVPNTLDPSMHGLDWKCMQRMFAGCLVPNADAHDVGVVNSDLEVDEDEVGDAALKNMMGEGALELAQAWAESGAPRKKLEVMEKYLSGAEQALVHRYLHGQTDEHLDSWNVDLEVMEREAKKRQEAERATPPGERGISILQRALDRERVKVCMRAWKPPRSQDSDQETDDDEEEHARTAHALFARLAGIEDPYPGALDTSSEIGENEEPQAVERSANDAGNTLSTPKTSPARLHSSRTDGENGKPLSLTGEKNWLKDGDAPLPLPTPPPTAEPASTTTDWVPVPDARRLKRKASRTQSNGSAALTNSKRTKMTSHYPAISVSPLFELNNLPASQHHRSQATSPRALSLASGHHTKRRRIADVDSLDKATGPSSQASSIVSNQNSQSVCGEQDVDETCHTVTVSMRTHRPRKLSFCRTDTAYDISDTASTGSRVISPPPSTEPSFLGAAAECADVEEERRRARRERKRLLVEKLRQAAPQRAKPASSPRNVRSLKKAETERQPGPGRKTDDHAKGHGLARAVTSALLPGRVKPLASASSFETVCASDEGEVDWERSRMLAEQIRADVASGRQPRIPRLESLRSAHS